MHKEAEFLQKLLPGYYMVSLPCSPLPQLLSLTGQAPEQGSQAPPHLLGAAGALPGH